MRTAPRILALAMAASIAGGTMEARQIGGGPPPTIQTRKVVAVGLVDPARDHNVREVDIAAFGGKVMVTFIATGHQVKNSIGYSYFDGLTWTEGKVSDPGFDDPSLAYGTLQVGGAPVDTFVCCYRKSGIAKISRFNPTSLDFELDSVDVGTPDGGQILDKSWIISGYKDGLYNDLHVTRFDGLGFGNLKFSTSRDGGNSWSAKDEIRDWTDPPETQIKGRFPQPTVGNTEMPGPIYLAYGLFNSNIRVMQGTETSSSTNSFWEFKHLENASGDLELDANGADEAAADVPGPFRVLRIPQLVADPSDPNRLYLIYHDAASPGSRDLDVFCATITYSAPDWNLGTPVRVNDDPVTVLPADDKDQILPKAVVDTQGRLHIVFYDDRKYVQVDADAGPAGIKFDVFYAVSLDGGANFTNIELAAIPKEPALQCGLTTGSNPLNHPAPGEYPGIVCDGDTVWIAFSGTWSGEEIDVGVPAPDKSVIYMSKVVY